MRVRPERSGDVARIRLVNCDAFGSAGEAALVDALREQADEIISLVAERDGEVVGHILFSPLVIEGAEDLKTMALAPMAVAPAFQRQGVGTALVRAGLAACARGGVQVVIVIGHPHYYPRFGFVPASRCNLACEFDVSDDAFMVHEIAPGILSGKSGVVRYPAAFAGVTGEH